MDQKIRDLERNAKIGTPADKDAYYLALLRAGQEIPSKKAKQEWYALGYRVVVATYRPNPNDPYEFHFCYRAQFQYSWKCSHNHKTAKQASRCVERHYRASEIKRVLNNANKA